MDMNAQPAHKDGFHNVGGDFTVDCLVASGARYIFFFTDGSLGQNAYLDRTAAAMSTKTTLL